MLCFVVVFLSNAFTAEATGFKVDISSAKEYIGMGKRAHEGQMPTRDDWNRLYGTEAYRVFIESEM